MQKGIGINGIDMTHMVLSILSCLPRFGGFPGEVCMHTIQLLTVECRLAAFPYLPVSVQVGRWEAE